MKLQISFDMTDLDNALAIAQDVSSYADILEVGTPLIYRYGVLAVERFKNNFPTSTILADTKIVDRGKDIASLCAKAGADWITVMAGTNKNVIHTTCTAADELNIKVMIDLLDSASIVQSALEAKNLGGTTVLFHQPPEERDSLATIEKWDLILGNASLPIFITGRITRNTATEFAAMKPYGFAIGRSITEAQDPAAEAQFFYALCNNGEQNK